MENIGIENASPELVIRSEEDAWRALEQAVLGENFPDNLQIRFDGWPSFKLDVSGRDWHSTVPTRVMPSLLEVQKDINRAYTHIRYDDFNLRRLKEEERDELEIVVKVKEGSSVFDADLWEQFSKMGAAAVERMSGEQAVITIISVALLITAPVMFKQWLSSRDKARKEESRIKLSQEETARLKIMAEAMRKQPALEVVHDDAVATTNRLLKAVKLGDNIDIKGISIQAEEARELAQAERESAKGVEIDGNFTILGNRTDKGAGFRVTVKRIEDDLTLSADVPPELDWNQKELIKQAEWSKSAVYLQIDAEMLRESISRAVVVSAEAVRS